MQKRRFSALVAIFTMALLVIPFSATPAAAWQIPKLDQIYMPIIESDDVAYLKHKLGELDHLEVTDWVQVQELTGLGFNVTGTPGFHLCYIGINCRDVIPPTPPGHTPTPGRPPGMSLKPLNHSAFRRALHYMWGVEGKAEAITAIFGGPIAVAIQSFIPPAQVAWYNPDVRLYPKSYEAAKAELEAAGFYISDGAWHNPDGTPIREIEVITPAGAVTQPMGDFLKAAYDGFLEWSGAPNTPKMKHVPSDWTTVVIPRVLWKNDVDLFWLCYSTGRFPLAIYSFFHSSNIGPGMTNYFGYKNTTKMDFPEWGFYNMSLDDLLFLYRWGTLDEDTAIRAVKAAQEVLSEDCPKLPVYSRTFFHSFGRWDVALGRPRHFDGLIDSYGYGTGHYAGWTWDQIMWRTGDTPPDQPPYSINWRVARPPGTLNPLYASTVYEWQFLAQVLAGLTYLHPYTHIDGPGIASDWKIDYYSAPGVPAGMAITFYLRPDVYWHDGVPFTSADVKFNLEYLKRYMIPRYKSVWENLLSVETHGPYKVVVFINATSLWTFYDVSGAAALIPPQVYKDVTTPLTFVPDATPHPAGKTYLDPFTGTTFTLSCLFGTGSYVFREWNAPLGYGRLIRRTDDYNFRNKGPILGYITADPYSPTVKIGVRNQDHKEYTSVSIKVYLNSLPIYETTRSLTAFEAIRELTLFDLPGYGKFNITVVADGSITTLIHTYTWREDLNYDLYIDGLDISPAAKAFGSSPGHIRWDSRADLTLDYFVDGLDISRIARKFGRSVS